MAVSSDGSQIVACAQAGQIWRSSNFGAFSPPLGSLPVPAAWRYVASSPDGNHLAAVVNGGSAYVSHYAGGSWSQVGPSALTAAAWSGVTISSDGAPVAATINGDQIFLSSDSGATATAAPVPVTDWYSIAGSTNGSTLLAGVFFGPAYVSSDAGATWQMR